MFRPLQALVAALVFLSAGAVWAQSGQVAFGSEPHDNEQPVEVTSDNLDVDQTAGTAVFTGDVVVIQGEMRLSAPRVLVVYNEDRSGIKRLEATGGGVILVNGPDVAEGNRADYDVETGLMDMHGNVILVQEGGNTITGDKLHVDTLAGTAKVDGRVKTILLPSEGEN
ncbi:Lipopolysaccharide export system protein LptA precursor [Roseovarius albus]|uniref:Lipopolysaccharide export system protein LptA n=1 Tax=Roseovarius albus TaxID=1247867 RepID=A0A1X6YSN8_9RHOB|nr:lipopolysaccharide transport periplasmic protein LptA [Roseovarius albus]SLN30131.1 Lipopolysaccharide export system protein LptA precursor [Roseovarius albus]